MSQPFLGQIIQGGWNFAPRNYHVCDGSLLSIAQNTALFSLLGTTFGGNHLACAAALAVLEVMEKENLIEMAKQRGMYVKNRLKTVAGIENLRGRGLMIGFDVPPALKDLRKNLLYKHNIFTGESKPNVIRLLPSLAINRKQVDEFIEALQEEIAELKNPHPKEETV